jgi:L-serine dehydratase
MSIISVFDLFSVGIGPSSSHTVGPMKAAKAFVDGLKKQHKLSIAKRVKIELFGSLAFTGHGHGTPQAILLGLEGHTPHEIDPKIIKPRAAQIIEDRVIHLAGSHPLPFHYATDFIFNLKALLPFHTNGMRYSAFDDNENAFCSRIYYSIGGGFILD